MTRFFICGPCAILGSCEIGGPGYIMPQTCAVCGLPNAYGKTDAAGSTRAHLALCDKLRNDRKDPTK